MSTDLEPRTGRVSGVAAASAPAPVSGPAVAAAAQEPTKDAGKVEDTLLLVILGGIILASLGVSFSHMHDWTMDVLPDGTHDAVGWINAVISELVPLASTLSLRKRLRQGKGLMSYPLLILLGSVVLSMAAQLSALDPNPSWSARMLVCLPAIAAMLLMKLAMSNLDANRKQAETVAGWERKLDAARAEITATGKTLAETRAALEAETGRAETEAAARRKAETAAASVPEIRQRLEAEIAARGAAERRAGEQERLARLAEGRLTEAREAGDRAAEARVLAEQAAREQIGRLTAAAEQTAEDLSRQLAEATGEAAHASKQVAELERQVRGMASQLEETRAMADRATELRVMAEGRLRELEQLQDGQVNEIERLRRALARATEQRTETRAGARAEISRGRRTEIDRPAARKSLTAVPVDLPDGLPVVETVKAETVARVLAAKAALPDATQAELHERTGISDRTIRKVLTAVPAQRISELAAVLSANEVPALPAAADGDDDGRAA